MFNIAEIVTVINKLVLMIGKIVSMINFSVLHFVFVTDGLEHLLICFAVREIDK